MYLLKPCSLPHALVLKPLETYKTKKSFSLMPEITDVMDRERMLVPKKTCTGFRRLRSHWDAQGRRKTAKPRNHCEHKGRSPWSYGVMTIVPIRLQCLLLVTILVPLFFNSNIPTIHSPDHTPHITVVCLFLLHKQQMCEELVANTQKTKPSLFALVSGHKQFKYRAGTGNYFLELLLVQRGKNRKSRKEAALESPWHVRYKVRRTDEQCDRYKEQDKSWTPSLKDLNSQVYRI